MTPMQVTVTKTVPIPNQVKLARYGRVPELGPRLLFFSGGTALRPLSHELTAYTHNSIHLITTFDSGGSSAVLRRAFHMPAIGDIRNRLMALADQTFTGNPEIFELFAHRLPKEADTQELQDAIDRMVKGKHPLVSVIPDPMRKIIRHHLLQFSAAMPEDFDLRGASIGNLVLTAGYLEHRRKLDPVIYIFSKLVEVRGVVRPILNRNLHLVAELEDGTIVAGQHLLTGKETPGLQSGIKNIFLSDTLDNPEPVQAPIRKKTSRLIRSAELICFPIGSFYSSLMANLLPKGVGQAVADTHCPKVFVPNTGSDPELVGHTLMDQVNRLLHTLRSDCGTGVPVHKLLNFIVMDRQKDLYKGGLDKKQLDAWGVQIITSDLAASADSPMLDPKRLGSVLLSLT